MISAPGYDTAGFTNISTSDGIVHGQVKQAGRFSFLRIYEAGHEVPFYQPLASLEIFERALKQVDVATGMEKCSEDYVSVGTPMSEYREGNGTMQFEVTPANATYNTDSNGPDPEPTWAVGEEVARRSLRKREVGRLGRPRMSRGGKRRF
jgi:hypothetical protein